VEQNSTNINRRNEEDKLMYPFMLVKQGIILFIIFFINFSINFLLIS